MYNITINEYTLYGVVVLSILILIIFVLGFIAHIYHTKRMFDSIDKFNDKTLGKLNTYSKQICKYEKNAKQCGINRCNVFVSLTKRIVDKIRDSCK